MKISILVQELKIFSRCVTSLSKLGDDIYIEYENNELSLRTVNSSRSAFGRFQFKSNFFESISDCESTKILSKLYAKSCLSVFKASNVSKNIERCKMIFGSQSNVLVIHLYCQNDISKTYNLHLIDCESLQARYSVTDSKNILTISTKSFINLINNFHINHEELQFTVDSNTCTWKSFTEDPDISKTINTKMELNLNEFDEYDIISGIDLIMCQKELRAALTFGEISNYRVHMSYSDPGKPFIISYSETQFKAHFVLATLASENSSANISLQRRLQKSRSTITASLLDFDDEDDETESIMMETSTQLEKMMNLPRQRVDIMETLKENNCSSYKRKINLFQHFENDEIKKRRILQNTVNELEAREIVLVPDSDGED